MQRQSRRDTASEREDKELSEVQEMCRGNPGMVS